MKDLMESVWAYSLNNPHGFTLNIHTLKPVRFGICVAYFDTQNRFGKPGLRHAMEHALAHQKIIGGWLNDQNELFYFDSVRIFENSAIKQAIGFAKHNKQLAIFDLTNLREMKIT